MQKLLLGTLILAAMAATGPRSAVAQNLPWCMVNDQNAWSLLAAMSGIASPIRPLRRFRRQSGDHGGPTVSRRDFLRSGTQSIRVDAASITNLVARSREREAHLLPGHA
jgi:hypothetical protein